MKISLARFEWNLRVWRERMAWFTRNSADEDKVVAQTGELLLGGVSDADQVAKIELANGRNLRDQMTVEEAEEMRRETDLKGWGWKRN